MIDRTKIPSFFRDFPEERLRELMEENETPKMNFDEAIDMVLRKSEKKQRNGATTSINKRK